MSYIGVEPKSGFIKADQEKITGQTTNYVNLTNSISSLDDVQIWVNYVIQDPSTLTLNSSTQVGLGDTLVSSDVVLVTYLGQSVATQNPANNSVTNDMLAGSIANSKLATDPLNASNLASGTVPTARLGSGTASSSTFLRGDSTFASAGEDNNPSFSSRMANHQQVGDNVLTKVAFDTVNYQTSGTYDTSNYRFTPAVAGNYQFIIQVQGNSKANANLHSIMIKLYKNGSALSEQVDGVHTNYATSYIFAGSLTFNLTATSDTNDYFEVYASVNDTSGTPEFNKYGSHFSAFKISESA